MGHSVGLEKHYERYQEEDFERFPEYQKAIPFLTISDEERQKIEIDRLKKDQIDMKTVKQKVTEQLIEFKEELSQKLEKERVERERIKKQAQEEASKNIEKIQRDVKEKWEKLKSDPKKMKQIKELLKLMENS